MSPDLEVIETKFRRIYLEGIPKVIADGTAFLSFVCIITATEALCGYLYGDDYQVGNLGTLFRQFVASYYPSTYGPYVDDFWTLRNKLVHAFSTGPFLLTHHHSERHLTKVKGVMTTPAAAIPAAGFQPFASTAAPINFGAVHDLRGPISATGNIITAQTAVVLNAEDLLMPS